MNGTKFARHLVLCTTGFLSAVFMLLVLLSDTHKMPTYINLNTAGQPTMGNPKAPIQLVIFEEPKCPECKVFALSVFPQIKKDYIDTGLASYTFMTVSFIEGSGPAAEALLSVYDQDASHAGNPLFFAYLDHLYQKQPSEEENWATVDTLVKFARETSPEIDVEKLKRDIEQETHRKQIENNTAYGTKLMGGNLGTPTLFIEGVMLEELSYSEIKEHIDRALSKHAK